jgi:hypothetical protein
MYHYKKPTKSSPRDIREEEDFIPPFTGLIT